MRQRGGRGERERGGSACLNMWHSTRSRSSTSHTTTSPGYSFCSKQQAQRRWGAAQQAQHDLGNCEASALNGCLLEGGVHPEAMQLRPACCLCQPASGCEIVGPVGMSGPSLARACAPGSSLALCAGCPPGRWQSRANRRSNPSSSPCHAAATPRPIPAAGGSRRGQKINKFYTLAAAGGGRGSAGGHF